MHLEAIQAALRESKLAGWLFFDHHRRDPLAYRILGLDPQKEATRRWYYFIPREGEPKKLVHQIESGTLDALPGSKAKYASWTDQVGKLGSLLPSGEKIAMQFSPRCAIPYVSLVDAGTIDLVRGFGVEVVSSAELVQMFESRLSEEQFASHVEAGRRVDSVRSHAFRFIGDELTAGRTLTEFQVQQFVRRRFEESGLTTDHGPIVAANANASDPHYEPSREKCSEIQEGDLVLIDMWAKLAQPDAVYYDITWTGIRTQTIPSRMENVFEVVRDARMKACQFVKSGIANGLRMEGWQVDDVARQAITDRRLGEFFFHRTGHSIGTEVHGTGANMDNLESHDERPLISNTCFSIEPGIYLPEFGIRSEVNMYIGPDAAKVTGEEQFTVVRI